jgi:nucleotide-binding universal stress UspA family protein
MNKVIACVDGAGYTASVCDYASWAAQRLSAPLEFLHALDRHPERTPVTDFSGSIGLGTQERLLEELSALDEKRSVLAQRHGREVLDAVVTRAKAAGLSEVEGRQRHGGIVESMVDLEPITRLFVMGQHHHGAGAAGRHHLDHNVERAIRALQRPVLVAAAEFQEPRRFAIAFDGSATGRKMVETLAGSPMLKALACEVVMSAQESASSNEQLRWAQTTLAAAGFQVQAQIFSEEPEAVLPGYITRMGVDLLVMGAYGHSRIRHLIVGSTTTTLLRTSPVPVLILR